VTWADAVESARIRPATLSSLLPDDPESPFGLDQWVNSGQR
jgi:hypothetical protein